MSGAFERIRSASARSVKALALAGNAYLGRYRTVVWLIGDGRSGTTWVSSLINHERRYREMFEPFHPRVLHSRFVPNQYLRPGDPHDAFRTTAARVFAGRLTHPRVDADARPALYEGLLIKDIFANLFACWALRRFPHLRIVLLLRHPFAVAVSKLQKRRWFWVQDPLDLLNQRALFDDYLRPFETTIRRVSAEGDDIAKQVLIWSIVNYVPLLQFRPEQLHVLFYEDVCARPQDEVSAVMRHIHGRDDTPAVAIDEGLVATPSRVTDRSSAVRHGGSSVDSWRRALTPAQIDRGIEILAEFGLEAVYSTNSMPHRQGLHRLQHAAS